METQVRIDTAYVRESYPVFIPFDRLSKETILVPSQTVNYDSLIAEAFKEWQVSQTDTVEKTFVVKADTTLPDSLVSAEIAFYSPLPIHPKSYFKNTFTTKIPVIKETITITKTETPWLTHGVITAIGYGFIQGKPDVFVGYGINLNLGKIL